MATNPQLQPESAPSVISDREAVESFSDVQGGFIDTFNDTAQKYKGKQFLPIYVQKLEGYTVINEISGETKPTKGAAMWTDPETSASNRFHKLWAVDNKIYLTTDDGTVELKDVTDDGFTITRMVGVMAKNNLYIILGDTKMDAQVYKYIGANTAAVAFTDNGGGEILATSVSHGLITGMTVTNADTTDYNGAFVITVLGVDTFKFTDTYVGDESGFWSVSKQIAIQPMTAMRAASNIMYWGQRLCVTGVGSDKSLPIYSVLNISGNFTDFTVSTDATGGGDFYGDLAGINCMFNHDGYGILLSAGSLTVHSFKPPLVLSTSTLKNPDTLNESLTVSNLGTQSPFGAISARGAVFVCDPSSGVFEVTISNTIAGFSRKVKELTKSWKSQFLKFDTSDAAVDYDSVRDLLLVSGVSTSSGGASDIVLVYSFRTGRWSSDPGKRARQIIASKEEKKLYGFGSTSPEIQNFFDGTHNDDGREKKLVAWTRMYDGGRRSLLKEHESTTQIFGLNPGTENILFEFIDGQGNALTNTTIDVTDEAAITKTSVPGEWGDYQPGAGSFDIEENFSFKQYYNDDAIDDFQRISVRLTEESIYPCLFFVPEILANLSSDFAEDLI